MLLFVIEPMAITRPLQKLFGSSSLVCSTKSITVDHFIEKIILQFSSQTHLSLAVYLRHIFLLQLVLMLLKSLVMLTHHQTKVLCTTIHDRERR